MAIEIKVPDMGESVIEATIARWMKQEGEPVKAGEPVVELETDKINLEVGAQQAGVLQKINKQVGDTVAVGDVLAVVGEGGGRGSSAPAQPAAPKDQAEAAPQEAKVTEVEMKQPPTTADMPVREKGSADPAVSTPEASKPGMAGVAGTPAAANMPAEAGMPQLAQNAGATPVAIRMAQDKGVDVARIPGSGPGGKVTKEDVEAFVSKSTAVTTPAPSQPAAERPPMERPAPAPAAQDGRESARETRVRMSRRRQTIARRLVEAQHTAAMLTTFNEIDMSAVMELRKRRREAFKTRFGVDLGFMSFFVKASIAALKAFPNVNAELASTPQGDELVLKHYYDIGVAIGAEEGLVVPVIRDADRLNFAGIEQAIKDFVVKVKDSTLSLDDLRGGTFTITNGGVYGSLMSTPILNPPQVAILGMHAIKERAVVINGEITARPMMYVALSYDHRVVDGREAVQFLVRIKEMVEDPEALLFG